MDVFRNAISLSFAPFHASLLCVNIYVSTNFCFNISHSLLPQLTLVQKHKYRVYILSFFLHYLLISRKYRSYFSCNYFLRGFTFDSQLHKVTTKVIVLIHIGSISTSPQCNLEANVVIIYSYSLND